MSSTLAPPAPRAGNPETHGQRLTRLTAEFSSHVQQQLADGSIWRCWQSLDGRLLPFADLSSLITAWQDRVGGSVPDALAALVVRGSARGGDDQLAAMTALVLMTSGVCRTAQDLRDLCEPEDVVVAVWLEIRRAEASIGRLVGRQLVKRARQRLIRESSIKRDGRISHLSIETAEIVGRLAVPEQEPPFSEFVDLLRWAERCGVMTEADVALLAELVDEERAGATRAEALSRAGARRGLALRTVRRHRQRALEALRRAVPDYLAATA
ncbi:hypothetical protein [Nocardioides dongkuii]|uniref:hypothetical protein n=1 Tax=Nocardioides dongkuii TaxID=2760089 RepID=UPI001878DCD3|nr:hypothetical protein [Nocardioides dongkuii]